MRTSLLFPTSRRGWFWLAMRMLFLIVLPLGLTLWYMIDVPGHSYRGPVAPLTAQERALAGRLHSHVTAIASEEHNALHPEALARAADYLAAQLGDMAYTVGVQNFDGGDGPVRNLAVEIKGATAPEQIVIVGAHYDSASGAPGANDNGSGTAMVLELARAFSKSAPQKTLRFVLFANEEPPYFGQNTMGSLVYARRSRQRQENIIAMLSLETVGYFSDEAGSQKYPGIFKPFFPGEGNFIAFIGDLKSRDLLHRSLTRFRSVQNFPSEGIAAFPKIKGIDWSDHSAFWANDYRALMVTDTAIFRYPHYHTRQDAPDKLRYDRMARLFSGVHAVVADLAGAPPLAAP